MKNNVAILEAKAHFQCLKDGRPIISDGCFAQVACEALAVRLSDLRGSSQHRYAIPVHTFEVLEFYTGYRLTVPDSVIVINAIQHYMCFLQFDMSDDYLRDLGNTASTKFL
jgi:hypothetical protein